MKPILVRLPADLGSGLEVLVRQSDDDDTVEVDVRPAHTAMTWRPLQMMGGEVVVRDQ